MSEFVLVIIGRRPEEKGAIADFLAVTPQASRDNLRKVRVGPQRMLRGVLADDPDGWAVEIPTKDRMWYDAESDYRSLETHVRQAMKGVSATVYFITYEEDRSRAQSQISYMAGLGWLNLAHVLNSVGA